MKSDRSFSGEYWQLHRNSLLISSALFVLSISSIKDGQSIAGITLNDMGHGSIVVLLTVAATYAMATLFFEWRHECWPSVRSQWVAIDEAKEAGKNALIFMQDTLDATRQKISEMADASRYFDNGLPEGTRNFLNSCINDIEVQFTRNYLEHPSVVYQNDEKNAELLKQKSDREIEILKSVAESIRDKINSSNHIYNNYYEDDVKEMKNELVHISNKIDEVKYSLGRTRLSLYVPFTFESTRVMVIGMVTPLALYILSVMHAVGTVGFPIWGNSWVVSILRHFN